MALRVDQLELGPIGTNCYLVRAPSARDEAVVVDPSGDADRSGSRSRASGARCAAILVTHGHFDHIAQPRRSRRGDRRARLRARGRAHRCSRSRSGVHAAGDHRPRLRAATSGSRAARRSRPPGITFDVSPCPGPLARPPRLLRRRPPLLRRRPLRRLGRPHRPPGRRLGDAARRRSHRSSTRYPPDTVVHPGHGPTTTLGAELARNPFLADLRAERTG